jgi:hypothetical protein
MENISKRTQGINCVPLIYLALLYGMLFLSLSCKDEPTRSQLPEPAVQLTFEDASCTEVWLKLTVSNVTNAMVTLKRGDSLLNTYTLTNAETTIIDEGLLPRRTYTYTGQLIKDSKTYNSTTQAHTMDTTSHNFTWQTHTLGDGTGSGCLYDVAIINDTLAYAIGEIYQAGTTYNAAKWDGTQWELKRIQSILCGSGSYIVSPLRTIFAFSSDDVWYSDGGEMIHWNGSSYINDCSMNSLLAGAINKIWGISSNDLYAVGGSGTIVHYNGSGWTKIESGTTLAIYDIYGAKNNKTGEIDVYAVATDEFYTYDKAILRINGNIVTSLSYDSIPYRIHGIWFKPNQKYYVVGSGIYSKHSILTREAWQWHHLSLTNYYINDIDGNDVNDIIACGAYGELLHFNGVSWNSYISQTFMSGAYTRVSLKGNLFIVVGYKTPLAVVTVGKR